MKKLLIILLSVSVSAQISEFKNHFRGNVKSMEIKEMDNDNPPKERITTTFFDQKKRKIREINSYNTTEEFYYQSNSDKDYALKANFNTKSKILESINIIEKGENHVTLLDATKYKDKWENVNFLTQKQTHNIYKVFYNNEISYSTTKKPINLSSCPISKELVPFVWDKNLSKAYEVLKTDFPDEKKEHQFHFEFYEKNNPSKKLIYHYNANDVEDSGKGYWYLYENNLLKEERYLYKNQEISDFGHRISYDKNGNKTSDIYGYFDKMPKIFITKNTFLYNEKGDLIKNIEETDTKNSKPFVVKYVYTYDSFGNWTSAKSIFDDGSGETIYRKFTYYKDGEQSLKNTLSEKNYTENREKALLQIPILEKSFANYLQKKKEWTDKPVAEKDWRSMKSKNWKDFLPARQILDTIATGDLNKDGIEDLAMVFTKEKLLESERDIPRTLRILFKDSDGNYRMIADSKNAIATEKNGNVFFLEITINKGVLKIEHEFIRGGCKHIYRYQDGGFYLIGANRLDGDASYTSTVDYNLSTGKYIYEYTNDNEDENQMKSQKKEGIQKLKTLPNIETYELFSLEVAGQNL